MRKIGIAEIEDIALGAALLGAGGGGDPYVGKLTAIGAVKDCGEVTLLDIDEVPDDAVIVPVAMVGAPTILAEKATGINEFGKLIDMISVYYGERPYAVMPIEAGGVNSLIPVTAAARLGLPMVDIDGMGRAFPEIQMVTFSIGGVSASPMIFIDEKGNLGLMETVTNKWVENICRAGCTACGGSVISVEYPMKAKTVREYGVRGIVTRSEELGRAIRGIKNCPEGMTPEQYFFEYTGGYRLFKGKIADVLRETRGGFNFGKVVLDGIGDDKGGNATVEFQNENLACTVNGTIVATTPDLICLVDTETFTPIPTDALKYGKRVLAVGLPCYHLWRTEAGLELVGPRYFGLDTDYVPVEERCKQ